MCAAGRRGAGGSSYSVINIIIYNYNNAHTNSKSSIIMNINCITVLYSLYDTLYNSSYSVIML